MFFNERRCNSKSEGLWFPSCFKFLSRKSLLTTKTKESKQFLSPLLSTVKLLMQIVASFSISLQRSHFVFGFIFFMSWPIRRSLIWRPRSSGLLPRRIRIYFQKKFREFVFAIHHWSVGGGWVVVPRIGWGAEEWKDKTQEINNVFITRNQRRWIWGKKKRKIQRSRRLVNYGSIKN